MIGFVIRNMGMKASAVANSNIALVKYWGKRNDEIILPYNSSISVTTEGMFAHTTVEFSKSLEKDSYELNGTVFPEDSPEYSKTRKFVDMCRRIGGLRDLPIRMVSRTNFPVAAGLASSAAGLAALATAIDSALDLRMNKIDLSKLARQGSGSASRSIHGGFSEWLKGEFDDGSDCYSVQLADENHWKEFRILFCMTSKEQKKIKSREGMKKTVSSSPLYPAWLATIEKDLEEMRQGIANRDIITVGRVAELNCLKMHSTMMTSSPSILYWNSTTINLMHAVHGLRVSGLRVFFTIDAGPQIKLVLLKNDVEEAREKLSLVPGVVDFKESKPGSGPKVVEEHLF